ncbi:hypothetical protein HOK40_00460 [Candidatus Peregrinibacteria bacterium]|jgi:hypothetical protein|nr:hypothetical protein [Candidatus Peregrinibacteria bacterium]
MGSRKTTTFDELRDRNVSMLKKAGHTPDVDMAALTSAKRKRVLELLEDRAEIEGLASTQSQREEYGVEEWHEGFVRLRDIPDERERARIWAILPNSRFKRFQQAFSHPHQFIVPSYMATEGGGILFTSTSNFNTMSLQPCLVSADLIPEKLAEDLGLVSFEDDDARKPQQRLEKKAQPNAIKRLKEIWETAVPLQHKSHRLLVIRDSDENLNGTLLYTRTEENGALPNSLRVQHFSSAYAAHRKTLHEGSSYRAEISKLSRLKQDITSLNTRLNRDWRAATPQVEKDAMREEATAMLVEYTSVLKRCENRFKVKAYDFLEGIDGFHDKSGKVNPSASLSKMVAAVGSLETRFAEMYPKGGYNEQDRMALQTVIGEQEHALKTFRRNLQDNALILDNGMELFSDKDLSEPQINSQSSGALRRMRIHPSDLDTVNVSPFTVYSGKLSTKYDELSTALHGRDREGAKDAALSMHVVGKFQSVRALFARIQEHMADEHSIPLTRVREFISDMRGYIDEHQLFPGYNLQSYSEAFNSMSTRLKDIEALIDSHSGDDVDNRSQMYKDLRKYIEEFDLEEMVVSLP